MRTRPTAQNREPFAVNFDQELSFTHYEHLKVRAAEMEMSISEYMYALIERDIQNRGPGTSEKRSQAAHTRWEKKC